MAVIMRKYIAILSILLAFQVTLSAQTAGQKDTLSVTPYGEASYSTTTGKLLTIDRADLQRHGIGDFRDRLTGMIPGLDVTQVGNGVLAAGSSGYGDYNFGSTSNNFFLNGFSSVRVLVDGIAIPYTQLLLEPNQIESVTVVSDALDKSKYGPIASYGAVLITTRKGEYDSPFRLTVDAQTGVDFIDRLPGFVNGVDYAKMNNMARLSAGMDPLYSDEDIEGYSKGMKYSRFTPCVNYKDLMLNNALSTTTFGIDASAGSRNIKYHIALNGMNYGDIIKASKIDYNKINVTANVSTKIGRYIEVSAGFMGLLGFRRTPNIGWNNYRSVPEIAYPLILGKVGGDAESDIATMIDQTIYGVSKTFGTNYYAELMEGGRQTERNRSGFFNVDLDIDFSWLLKGLKSKTYLMTSSFLSTVIGKNNDYIAYYWDKDAGIQEISSHKGVKATSRSRSDYHTSQFLTLSEKLYYDWAGKGHNVHAAATYYQSANTDAANGYTQKLQYILGDFAWSYKGRYNVEATAQYSGSSRYKEGARWGFFPTVGLSWIATNEEFLKDNDVLTNLKVHAQFGQMPSGSLFGTHYLYQSVYGLANGMAYGPAQNAGLQWFGNKNHTSQSTTISRLANEDLTWERLSQQNVGVDVELFDCVTLSADWFRWRRIGMIDDILSVTPNVFGVTATVYDNYEERLTSGFNLAAGFNRTWGDFTLNAWASATFSDQIQSKLVSDVYLYDYQKKTGTSAYNIRGLECVGKYTSQEDIDTHPNYTARESLKVGDLKYKDQNGDGIIDANDNVVIGNTNPKLRYALNISMSWKNFDLLVVGTGHTGADQSLTFSSYFTGTTGMSNYSAFMKNELGDEFPRLDYYGVENNTVASSFWLRKLNWFKIQTVDLGYTFPLEGKNKAVKSIRLDIMGNNLLTFTDLDYVDPESPESGLTSYPLFKNVTFGVKLNF